MTRRKQESTNSEGCHNYTDDTPWDDTSIDSEKNPGGGPLTTRMPLGATDTRHNKRPTVTYDSNAAAFSPSSSESSLSFF
jgi:hypothetical protein